MGDNSDAERELLAATDVDTDSEWEYEEEEITEDSNSCNFYNEEQSLENRSDAMDADVEDDDPPVIQHTTPMAMIENVIDVSQFRSGPVSGQSGVRVHGGLVCGSRVHGSRVCGGANARVIRGARVRGGRAAALGVRIPHNNTQTKWKAQSEVPFDPDEDIPDPFPFHENVGLNRCMQENASVLDYLQLYLTDNVFDHLVTETNRFAEQFIQDNLVDADNSYTGLWVPVTRNEMKKFIGLVLLMGIIYKPTVPLYCSTDEMFVTPIFFQVMSCVRFQLILKS